MIKLKKNKVNYLRIKVIPKSSRNEIIEIMEEQSEDGPQKTIKIRIKAVPEKGKANEELMKFLSENLNISKNNISIISGKNSQLKLVKIASDKRG